MNETLSCFLSPGDCISSGINAIINLVPFGIVGVAFIAGLICGAALGKWGVAALLVLAAAVRFGTKSSDVHEHVTGKDAAPPVKPRPTIFRKK